MALFAVALGAGGLGALLRVAGPQALAFLGKGQGGGSSHSGHPIRQPAAVTNGLVAWYPMDGDAKDYSGNGNDGTPTNFTFDGTTNGWSSGKFGKSLLFNGSSTYVNVPSASSLNFAGGDFTVSAWINSSYWNTGVPASRC